MPLPPLATTSPSPSTPPYTATLKGPQSIGNLTLNAAKANLYITGDSILGTASLEVTGNATLSAGHVQLQGTANYSASLTVDGTLTINSAASLTAFSADGTPTTLTGNITNAGVISDAVDTTLNGIVTNTGTFAIGLGSGAPVAASMPFQSFVRQRRPPLPE